MGLSKAFDHHLVTVDGNVKTSGGGRRLAMGQFAIKDVSAGASKDGSGAVLVDDFVGKSKRNKFSFLLGKAKVGVTRSLDNKSWEGLPFTLEDIVDIKVKAPEKKDLSVDEFVIGYNGDRDSEIKLELGDNEIFQLSLRGKALSFLGYHDSEATVQFHIEAPYEGDKATTATPAEGEWTIQEQIYKAVERLKNYDLLGQNKLTDLVDISVVDSTLPETLPGSTVNFYNLTLQDRGTYSDLARVQAFYPTLDVKVKEKVEGATVYSVIGTSLPAAYTVGLADILKGCEDCPTGYSELAGGIIYSIQIEDDGTDVSDTLEAAFPGAVADSFVLNGRVAGTGIGLYSGVVDDELTDGELDTIYTAQPTASIELVGDVVSVCTNAATTSTAWVQGEACSRDTENYYILLGDDECGNSRIDELVAAYPNLTITEEDPRGTNISIRLVGTSGNATLTIGSNTYPIAFDTNLETTVDNFVAAQAANILADTGFTLTDEGAVQDFRLFSETIPVDTVNISVANVDGDLAGSGTQTGINFAEGCQRAYYTTVTTNVVCEECDNIYRDIFESEAPVDFDLVPWKKVEKAWDGTAKMGIKFKAKKTVLSGSEEYRDEMDFILESPRLSLVGGFPTDINESWKVGRNERFVVKLLSRFEPAFGYGGHLREYEDRARVYFDGNMRHEGNNYAKYVLGEETRLKGTAQYVDYIVSIHKRRYTTAFSDKVDEGVIYHVLAEVGKHQNVESLLNKLAAAAGLPAIQAYPNS